MNGGDSGSGRIAFEFYHQVMRGEPVAIVALALFGLLVLFESRNRPKGP